MPYLDARHTVFTVIILKCVSEHVSPLLKISHWPSRAFKTKVFMSVKASMFKCSVSLVMKMLQSPLTVFADLFFTKYWGL